MSLKFNTPVLSSLLIFIFGCSQDDFRTADSGLEYYIIRNMNGEEFRNNHVILFNMDYYDENDSLLYSYRNREMPATIRYIDSVWQNAGQLYEGLNRLTIGDSAILKVNCENLFRVSFNGNVPHHLDPQSKITFYVGVVDQLNNLEFNRWQASIRNNREDREEEEAEEQLWEDISIIDYYMEMNDIIPLEHQSGLRYVIREKGGGAQPEQGGLVTIHYRGRLLDGTPIGSSYEEGRPMKFILGNGEVIEGWEKGISLMREGDKFTFYIPSTLAYGKEGSGSMIIPNSILIFDIELMEVEERQE